MGDEEKNQSGAQSPTAGGVAEVRDVASIGADTTHAIHQDIESAQHLHQTIHGAQHSQITASSLRMDEMAASLPEYGPYRHQHPSHLQPAHTTSISGLAMYPYQPSQFAGSNLSGFPPPFAQHVPPQMYQTHRPYSQYPINPSDSPVAAPFANQIFYPQTMLHGSMQSQYPHFQHYQPGQIPAQTTGEPYGRGSNHYFQSQSYGGSSEVPQPSQTAGFGSQTMSSTFPAHTPNALRGPPRKPKQSGHALWVGNLPPGTNIIDLKDHFSRNATDDIESVFLISKSNCAFVNYKSETSCASAMARFHDSRFQGIRLVCRLRRGSAAGPNTVRDLSPSTAPVPPTETRSDSLQIDPTDSQPKVEQTEEQEQEQEQAMDQNKVKEKFFIIKSLTIEDLERSVRNGIWATQSHNEATLNQAFESAENVYLIFSANKSGEYFGFARMDSFIDDKSAASLGAFFPGNLAQEPQSLPDADLPLTIPTPASATAPKGHIIDDSARGTIFWEAESSVTKTLPPNTDPDADFNETDSVPGDEDLPNSPEDSSRKTAQSPPQSTTFGRPFRISWQSTNRLPFYRTRGLRNPWNTNREVKIARDGTELEPNVGRKLIGMFGTSPGVAHRLYQQQQFYPAGTGQILPGGVLGPGQVPGSSYQPY